MQIPSSPLSMEATAAGAAEALRSLVPLICSVTRASDSGEACAAALAASLAVAGTDRGLIVLHNRGAFADDGIATSWRVATSAGEWGREGEQRAQTARLVVLARSAHDSTEVRTSVDAVAVPFSTATGDLGALVLGRTAGAPPIAAFLSLLMESLGTVLVSLARRDGWVRDEVAARGPDNAYALVRRSQQLARRTSSSASILVVSLDGVAAIRAKAGAAAAEYLVRAVARLIAFACRATDSVRALDDDQLLVALPSTNFAGGVRVAESLRRRVERTPFEFDGQGISATVSIGVAPIEVGAFNPRVVVALARKALLKHQSEKEGGNCVVEAAMACIERPQ